MTAPARRLDEQILVVTCPDRRGVVAAVSGFLADHGASIVESNHFNDATSDRFYMRTVFRPDVEGGPSAAEAFEAFAPIADRFSLTWSLHASADRPKTLIFVSKFGHCLHDLLYRWRSGRLPVEIAAVVSNHEDMRSFVEWNGLTYLHLPIVADRRLDQERAILALVERLDVDLVVLARYMQVLSRDVCERLSGRCINIHHSFLPSFKGAKPYHQAFAHGVKLIGATAHYVTTDLDEGPIIEQDVQRVDHGHTPEDLVKLGQDVECSVLARAVTWHAERRILINGRKTVVFGR
jgi:formyltetrahydrofolate deformylase